MNFNQYEKLFRAKASKLAWSEDDINSCLHYAKPLIEINLPVIYNTANLAALVGYRTSYLKKAAKFTNYYYRTFKVRKSNGSFRSLTEPLPSLKEIQQWILNNILYEVKISKFAKAYIKNKSIIENVKFHKNKEEVLTLDISDFFGSVKQEYIEKIFLDLGYSSNISNLFSKLCTLNGSLPQGAPTSPFLSNIFLKTFDENVSNFCLENDIRYTRYADDLTFSSDKANLNIINFIEGELSKLSLNLNKDKTRVMGRNVRQVVTGVVVNEKLQVPKDIRNFIRNEVYYLTKYGLNDHLKRTGNKKNNYIPHLLGKINYALHINPSDKNMKKYKKMISLYIDKSKSE